MQSGCRKVEERGVKGKNVARERAKMVGKRRFGARVYEKKGEEICGKGDARGGGCGAAGRGRKICFLRCGT